MNATQRQAKNRRALLERIRQGETRRCQILAAGDRASINLITLLEMGLVTQAELEAKMTAFFDAMAR